MPLIPFPNIPIIPGVPGLARSISIPAIVLLADNLISAALGLSDFGGMNAPSLIWGIFDKNGNQALYPDSFIDVDYRNDVKVSNYPQESGAFASYNHVGTPYDCRIRMAIGSNRSARTAFLATCDAMIKSIDFFTLVTPEVTYTNAVLESYDYKRESKNGVSMIIVDLKFIEIRTTATSTFSPVVPITTSSTIDPKVNIANPVSSGQVQATIPTPTQAAP